jgi:hypothetical protein
MPTAGEPNPDLDEFNRREMEGFKRLVETGVLVGVPAALHYCAEYNVTVPRWLTKAALELLCDLLKREKSTKRGRSAGAVARYRKDMIDMTRWNEVCVLREKQSEIHETVSYYAKTSLVSSPRFAEEAAKAQWLGRSLSRTYECVSEVLQKTEAFGSPESIKRSYREVERNHRDPSKAFRYAILDIDVLSKLGIDYDLGYGHGAKIAPWRASIAKKKKDSRAAA